jgi:rhamnose transport system permease protein
VKGSLLARFREAGILVFLAVVVIGTAAVQPRFLELDNLRNIVLNLPLVTVVAMGMTMVIVSRNIDLSVGSMLGLSAMVVGMLFKYKPGFPVLPAALVGVLVGFALGAANGVLVTKMRVPAIITTLGTMSVFRGLVFIISGGQQIDRNDIPAELFRLTEPSPIGLPWLLIIALAVAALAHFYLRYQRGGRDLYAVGSNLDAARLLGIGVDRAVFTGFAVTGALAGLAGVMWAARFGFVNPGQTGLGFELSVIAAVVIGGTDIFGGVGSVLGTLLGCLLLTVIDNALTILHLSGTWQVAVYGAVILAAILTDSLIRSTLRRGSAQ